MKDYDKNKSLFILIIGTLIPFYTKSTFQLIDAVLNLVMLIKWIIVSWC